MSGSSVSRLFGGLIKAGIRCKLLIYNDYFRYAGVMLQSGGIFMANNAVLPVSPMQPTAGYLQVVYSPTQHDHFFWYQRQ